MSFAQILRTVFILALIIPSSVLYILLVNQYKQLMTETAYNNTRSVIAANNSVLELSLGRLEELAYLVKTNSVLFDLYKDTSDYSTSDYLKLDREVRKQFSLIFSDVDLDYNAYLYTKRWAHRYEPYDLSEVRAYHVRGSELITRAEEHSDAPNWITGLTYGRTQPITMTLKMRLSYSHNGVFYSLDPEQEVPILIIHVLESSIRRLYQNTLDYDNQLYAILDEEDRIISSNSELLPIGEEMAEVRQTPTLTNKPSTLRFEGQEYLLSTDEVEGRGWLSFSLIPMKQFTANINSQVRGIYIWSLLIFSGIAVLLSIVITRFFSRPIQTLTAAAERVATGDFSANTASSRIYDFQVLTESFNQMEVQINELIEENYGISLREKESRLTALARQLNPHFLHNTLNIINLMAIEAGSDEMSEMIVNLSEILNFTFREKSEKIQLRDEMLWLSRYIDLMKKRFQDLFEVEIHVDPDAADALVPKFVLQPFVENAILHAFEGWQGGGLIRIDVTREHEGHDLVIQISDNGVGMSPERLAAILEPSDRYEGVGVSNIHRRLLLIYGEQASLTASSLASQGTCFILTMPFEQMTMI